MWQVEFRNMQNPDRSCACVVCLSPVGLTPNPQNEAYSQITRILPFLERGCPQSDARRDSEQQASDPSHLGSAGTSLRQDRLSVLQIRVQCGPLL